MNESPVIRKWRVIAATEGSELPIDDAQWRPAYSKVSGVLIQDDFPAGSVIFARGFVDVLAAGSIQLKLNEPERLTLWVDGKRFDDLAGSIELDRGRHSLTFAIGPKRQRSGLRVELKAIGDVVKFQPEGGP